MAPGQLWLRAGGAGALHFAALSGRFIQNLRRHVGDDVQYFAAALSRPRHRDHLMGSPGWAAAGLTQ